ncbi:aminoglycoside phosphotransferase [Frankia sp. KB5]|nr:aminoglycoside phosphotransferase [Frankia sp. KB5]
MDTDAGRTLRAAANAAGLPIAGAVLVRAGENAIYRLTGDVVARVSRTGQEQAAAKEVAVAQWLEAGRVPAVRLVPDLDQPILAHGRAVTFWRELPAHRHGTPREVGRALRQLHDLAPPDGFQLGPLLPFTRLRERIDMAQWLAENDRGWLRQHLAELEARWPELPPGLPHCVVHGDAWLGNVVATEEQAGILLDLERCSVGPPEWDLVSTAIKVGSTGTISRTEYAEFVEAYGHDVTAWPGYELLRDIRELRITCYGVQQGAGRPEFRPEAQRRVDCLRGLRGPRPWGWVAIG